MDRRNFLKNSTVAAGATLASLSAMASSSKHDHSKMGKKVMIKSPLSAKQRDEVYSAVSNCISKAQVCLSHCITKTAQGETGLMECLNAVQNMLPVCEATRTVVGTNTIDASALKAVAQACQKVCQVCEEACKKHADHHSECKDCAEACAKSSKALQSLV